MREGHGGTFCLHVLLSQMRTFPAGAFIIATVTDRQPEYLLVLFGAIAAITTGMR